MSQSVYLWKEGFFEASDQTRLFYRFYQPPHAKKRLILLHGFGEHAHRYEKFSGFFPNFEIAIFDMRGMGQSGGERVYVESYERFELDALDFFAYLDNAYPSHLPQILFGHSMGGLTLMRAASRYDKRVERYVFSAPCFRPAVPRLALKWNQILAKFYPRFVYHHPVHYLNLTHDSFERLSYKNDPWIMRDMTAQLLSEMTRAGDEVIHQNQPCFRVPVHFLLAGEDRLVSTRIAENVYQKIVAPDKTLIIYKNFYHEIFNEFEQTRVFEDLQKIIC